MWTWEHQQHAPRTVLLRKISRSHMVVFCVISIAGQRTFESTNHHYFNLQLLPLSRILPIMVTIWQSQKEIGDVLQAADEAEAKWFPLTAGGEGDKKSFACINHSTFVVFCHWSFGRSLWHPFLCPSENVQQLSQSLAAICPFCAVLNAQQRNLRWLNLMVLAFVIANLGFHVQLYCRMYGEQ